MDTRRLAVKLCHDLFCCKCCYCVISKLTPQLIAQVLECPGAFEFRFSFRDTRFDLRHILWRKALLDKPAQLQSMNFVPAFVQEALELPGDGRASRASIPDKSHDKL